MADRVAVVTGGGGGIGSEVAARLAADGALVVVVDTGVGVEGAPLDEPVAEATVRRIERAGGRAAAATVSVTDRAAIDDLFGEVQARHGALDVVVNTAGFLRFAPPTESGADDWAAVLDVHLGGYLAVLSAALPRMAAAGSGRVLGLTSGVGLARTSTRGPAYGTAKRGVAALTWQVGRAAPAGVAVNALSPIAATRMVTAALVAAGANPRGLDLTAMPRPADMAATASFLTDPGRRLSGQVVFCAGTEVSLIGPPRLSEVAATTGGRLADLLPALVPEILVPAEVAQRSTGGSNPRIAPPFAADAGRGSGRCVLVTDDAGLTAGLRSTLDRRGWTVTTLEPGTGFGGAERDRHLADADAVIVAPVARPADDHAPSDWQSILRAHDGVLDDVLLHAGWTSATLRSGHPRRVINVVPATDPGGRTTAQAVVQTARSLNDSGAGPRAFAVAVESAAPADADALHGLLTRLVTAQDTAGLAGAELVVGAGWAGLRSHPAPLVTVTLAGEEPGPWLEDLLAGEGTGSGAAVPPGRTVREW